VLPPASELHNVFAFEHVEIDQSGLDFFKLRKWPLPDLKAVINKWQTYLRPEGFWNSVYMSNHDQARALSRFGNDSDEWRTVSAKMLAILEISLGGTLYVYQGEEIGMRNFPRSWGIEEYKDICTINYYEKCAFTPCLSRGEANGNTIRILQERRDGAEGVDVDMSDLLDVFQKKARDHARTPMQVRRADTDLESLTQNLCKCSLADSGTPAPMPALRQERPGCG
jgi:oligo-1,6-glucosidase